MNEPRRTISGSRNATPRWVYAFGLVALALILAFVVVHLTGRGLGGHAG